MLNILGHEGNTNQNNIQILSHSSPQSESQTSRKQAAKNAGEDLWRREPSYTVGEKVN
jgi:hypothetical protein